MVEEVRHQVNLSVGDGNHVRRDIGGYVACLCLDDGQCGQRAAAFHLAFQAVGQVVHLAGHFLLVDDLRGALQQTGVQVEDVARIGLTSGGSAQNQRHLTIGNGLFGQVVIDHQGVAAGVAEVLADGGARKRGVILQGGRVGSRGGHHDGVVHGSVLAQGVHDARHGGAFLSDSHVDAIYRVACLVVAALVDDGVDGNSGLARLAVADDQLTLTASDGDHGVHGLQSCLQGLVHRLAVDDARCLAVQRHFAQVAADESFAVQGHAQWVDDTPQHTLAYHDGGDALGALHRESFLDFVRRTQQYGTDVVLFQIHDDAYDAVLKFHQLTGLGIAQAIDTCHAVAHLKHGANLVQGDLGIYAFQLFAEDIRNFAYFYIFR